MRKTKKGSKQKLVEQQNQKLKGYAEQLNRLQTDIESNGALSIKHGKIALELALRAGAILRDAKDLVPKKQWGKWIEENVRGITTRTAQNYMRLATEVAIEKERVEVKNKFGKTETQYVSFLADCEGLREAYLVAGIIKTPKMIDATINPDENEMTPERMKNEDEGRYAQKVGEARLKMAQRIRNELSSPNRVTWNLAEWTIQNDKVRSVDEGNKGAALFQSLIHWMTLRNFSSLTPEDEICHKAGVILAEVLRAIILANRPATSKKQKPEASIFKLGNEPKPAVEVAQKLAA